MSQFEISDLSRSIIEVAWHFGPKGIGGECCENLSMPEFMALDKIATTADCPVQEVGRFLGFTKSGATRVVNRLEKKDYVRKIQSHEDARICCVVLTSKGKEVLLTTDNYYKKQLDQILSQMPESLAVQTKEVFAEMARVLKE